jgi:hypothetical protein
MTKQIEGREAFEEVGRAIEKQILDYLNLIYPVSESQKFKTWPPKFEKPEHPIINLRAI